VNDIFKTKHNNLPHNIFNYRTAEVVLVGSNVAMYTNSSDCYFYVVGSSDSNELILGTVLDTLLDSVGTLLKESIDKHSLLNNLELILLVMDEIVDNGVIFETDPYKVANRVLMIVRNNIRVNLSLLSLKILTRSLTHSLTHTHTQFSLDSGKSRRRRKSSKFRILTE